MASSMTKIASVTVGSGGSSSISFTSIPQTYTDLVVKASPRSTSNSTGATITFNGSSTSFTNKRLYGDGSAAASDSAVTTGVSNTFVNDSTFTASTFGNGEFYIPNYAGSTYKSVSVDGVTENNATTALSMLTAGLWSNTAAITSITITPAVGNFAEYSTATLYGVLKYAETGTGSKAIGGTVTTSGGYTYHTFFSSGMFTPSAAITGAEVLVVAGGGGSSSGGVSGGAGAGGLIYASSQSYSSGIGYSAIVGAGGGANSNGTNSSFASGTVAIGGGTFQAIGGSGGGANANGSTAPGNGTAGQGNNGGTRGSNYAGGGGGAGGTGGTGGTNTRGGAGGVGVSTYSAWGSATVTGENIGGTYWYAGGGGGSAWNGVTTNNHGGNPGSGGGGAGGESGASSAPATSGAVNTGGGAGGDNAFTTRSGGSGIVIVRYTT